jgi:hypothetical protein
VTVNDAVGCRIFIGACAGAVFLRRCTGCLITVAAAQLHVKDCCDCVITGNVTNDPTMEGSWDIVLGPHNGNYALLRQHLKLTALEAQENRILQVGATGSGGRGGERGRATS